MLNIVLYGAGRIGRVHAMNVAQHPGATLRYVADPQADAAGSLADATGAAVAGPAVGAILIASSADTHGRPIAVPQELRV